MLKNAIADKYWEKKLSWPLPEIGLLGAEYNGNEKSQPFIAELPFVTYDKINKLSGETAAGQFIYFLTVLGVALNKYSGCEDVIVATGSLNLVSSDRKDPDTIFLRTEFSPGARLKELLNTFRQTVLEAYKYQGYSYEGLISFVKGQEQRADELLFQIGLSDTRIGAAPERTRERTSLWIDILPGDGTLKFSFSYKNKYERQFIEQFSSHFILLCTEVINNPDRTADDLKLLSPVEQKEMIDLFTGRQVNTFATLPHLFAKCVNNKGDETALFYRDSKISYLMLDKYSDALSSYLINECEIKPGSIVGVSLVSSSELVITILAILKAGAVVLPIEVSVPLQRINSFIEDSGATVLISEKTNPDFLSRYCIDRETVRNKMITSEVIKMPLLSHTDLAYIIYTSGSTGISKAVKLTHENIVSQFHWFKDHFKFLPEDVIPQKTTIGFVDSILELLFPITVGKSSVYLRPHNEVIEDIPKFVEWLTEIKTTIIQFVPSVFDYIQSVSKIDELTHLRALILTGEELKRTYNYSFPVYNIYGSSECTAYSLIYELNGKEEYKIPIGSPVHNTSVYILQKENELSPFYITGEIYIGGRMVSSGYLNRPELSSERFIRDICIPDATMYKTGDFGRYLPNGNIEYFGRKDGQLKIRGQRIEPGEIESKIRLHPAVNEVVVWSSSDEKNEPALSAYITVDRNSAYTIREIIRLKQQRPRLAEDLYDLPNGLPIYPLNKRESGLLYNEIFTDNTYIRNGININEGDVIFDVGANIGLFTLYAGLNFKHTKIYAFEPIPPIYEALSINTSLYNIDATLFDFGLAGKEEEVKFSYYENNTALSGRYAVEGVEKDVVRNYIKNNSGNDVGGYTETELNDVINERIRYKEYDCKVRRLSDVIRENDVERIHFLKIDVEKSELDVVNGIDDEHWPLIMQIAIEIHDIDNRGQLIHDLLLKRGFHVYTEQEALFRNTDIINLYATRKAGSISTVPSELAVNNNQLYTSSEILMEQIATICKKQLPLYMVPAKFRVLETLPRLANGKIDRKALESIDKSAFAGSRELVHPGNATEEKLSGIIADILKKTAIGTDESFFKHGGHSLNATQLTTRIVKEFSVKITLKDVFDNPTIKSLATLIAGKGTNKMESIELVSKQNDYPASFSQKRLWLINQLPEMDVAYNITGAFIIEGTLDISALEKAFISLIDRHEILRTVFVDKDGIPFQKIVNTDDINFKINYIDLQRNTDQEKRITAMINEHKLIRFDLSQPALLQLTCIRVKDNKYIAVLTIHHIISDGWSVKLMIKETLQLYTHFVSGGESPAPLDIQYKDYAAWHSDLVHSGKLSGQRDYWMKKLEGKIHPLTLPYDNVPKSGMSFDGVSFSFVVEGNLLEELRSLGTQTNTTFFVIILAAYNVLLSKEARQEDIYVGVPVAGREHNNLESQLGFYVNLLAFKTHVSDDISFFSLLTLLREDAIKAFQNQLFPFDLLMEKLDFDRSPANPGFITAGFTWNGNEEIRPLSASGIKIKPIEIPPAKVKHDLWLVGTEYPSHVQFSFEYRSSLFKKETIGLLAEKFTILLEHLVRFPERPAKNHHLVTYADIQLKEQQIDIDLDL